MRVRVAVNGYGTIGKRVADAVAKQPDMTLVGVSKVRANFEAAAAVSRGYPLYLAPDARKAEFDAAHLPVAGTVSEMIAQADVVVDATPEKVGRANALLYDSAKVRAVFQGGEKADIADVSFSALANFDAAKGKRKVRVVSCNTTGLARAADPAETKRGPLNGILPTFQMPSHHGPDVRTIFPDLPIATTAVVVPTTLMHVHVNHVRLARPPKDSAELASRFRATPRFRLFEAWEGVEGTPQVMEVARDSGNGRPDVMENVVWENGIRVDGTTAYFFQAIHQESIVVPENIDAIRAMFDLAPDGPTSIARTDQALGISASDRP